MTSSGSDTETDDELLERVQASRTRATKAPSADDASPAPADPVVPAPVDPVVQAPGDSIANTLVDPVNPAADPGHPPASRSSFLALILNSDDDEPPRFEQPNSATVAAPRPRSPSPGPASEPLSTPSIEKVEHPVVQPPQHEHVPAPQQSEPDPLDGHFVSPFAALAVTYCPPPPPVYGAPPVSYVPGQVVARPHRSGPAAPQVPCFKCSRMLSPDGVTVSRAGLSVCSCCHRFYAQVVARSGVSPGRFCSVCDPAQRPNPVPAQTPASAPPLVSMSGPRQTAKRPPPQVPCFKCSRVLSRHGSAVARKGQSVCTCCRRFYIHVVQRPGTGWFCSVCDPQAAVAPERQVTCAKCAGLLSRDGFDAPRRDLSMCSCCHRFYAYAVGRPGIGRFCSVCDAAHTVPVSAPPAAPARAPAPAPAPAPAAVQPATHTCGLCKETVKILPPVTASDRLQCNCCSLVMSRAAFSKNQQRPDHPCRRCISCTQTRETPDKFRNIHKKHNPLDPNNPHLTKRQRARLGAQGVGAVPSQRPTTTPPQPVVCTPEERRQMEISVSKFKLAKRSIHRRREANDLRGSTRVEYLKQLDDEERKVDEDMAKARWTNPALYDEVFRGIKVSRAAVSPSERDNAGKKKKNPKKASPSAKRKSTDGVEHEPKRPRVSTPTAAAPQRRATPRVSSASEASDASPPRTVVTRARTRQAAKPVVVIDLLDSDSE